MLSNAWLALRRIIPAAGVLAVIVFWLAPATSYARVNGACIGQVTVHELFLCVSPDDPPADGSAKVEAHVYDNMVTGNSPAPQLSSSDPGNAIGPLKRVSNGEYAATITASRTAGLVTITARLGQLKKTATFYQVPIGGTPHVCVYVDDPNHIPPTGHTFLQLLPDRGPQAGSKNLVYGFATDPWWQFLDGPGVISSNATHHWSFKICYPVSVGQYDSMEARIAAQMRSPPRYRLLSFNCTDWVIGIVQVGGIKLPPAKGLGSRAPFVSDPVALELNLRLIGAGHEFAGGIVHKNSGNTAPNGGADPPPFPRDVDSYTSVVDTALSFPATLAAGTHLRDHERTHAALTIGRGRDLSILLPHVDPKVSVVAIDWGDGSATFQHPRAAHRYARGGRFVVRTVVVRDATLFRSKFATHVTSHGGNAHITFTVPHDGARPNFPHQPTAIAPLPL